MVWSRDGHRRLTCADCGRVDLAAERDGASALDGPRTFAAFLFAVAATLQQKGALHLPKVSLTDPSSLLKLIGQTMWLFGTIALLCGYVVQAIALDEGRLSIIQPLLVTTVVFAPPARRTG